MALYWLSSMLYTSRLNGDKSCPEHEDSGAMLVGAGGRGAVFADQSERVIHVSSGGDGPRVEMSTGGSMFNPEASASPDQE